MGLKWTALLGAAAAIVVIYRHYREFGGGEAYTDGDDQWADSDE